MKRGKKYQIRTNKKSMRIMWLGLSVISLSILVLLITLMRSDSEITSDEILYQKRFVQVKNLVYVYEDDVTAFDLQSKEYFENSFAAIKNNHLYGYKDNVEKFYSWKEKTFLTNAVLNLKVTKGEIKQSNFNIVRDVYPLLDKNELKEEFPMQLENLYKIHDLKKIRITYNKKYLPTKLEGYYEDKKKWKGIRELSYPYKTKADFDKELDRQIEIIKEIEREKEEE